MLTISEDLTKKEARETEKHIENIKNIVKPEYEISRMRSKYGEVTGNVNLKTTKTKKILFKEFTINNSKRIGEFFFKNIDKHVYLTGNPNVLIGVAKKIEASGYGVTIWENKIHN